MSVESYVVSFGNNVRKKRRELGMTSTRLADMTSLDASTISRYENGNTPPSFRVMMRICNALQCTPNDLIFQR